MSQRWVFTINFSESIFDNGERTTAASRREDEFQRLLTLFKSTARYAIIGKETGTESGILHLQGYASMYKVQRLKGFKKLVGDRAHCQPAKGNEEQNYKYCSKQGDFSEVGERSKQGKRNDLLEIAEQIKAGASLQTVADLAPATYIRNYRGIANYKALQSKPYQHDTVRGIWLYGPPGVGKSHHARLYAEKQGELYIKPQNKWFDGYSDQEVILLDDLDTNHLGHYLKIWADKWHCDGEIKGGTVKLQHKVFIITSNYTPALLWKDDKSMEEAVTRRFKMIHVTGLTEHLKELK